MTHDKANPTLWFLMTLFFAILFINVESPWLQAPILVLLAGCGGEWAYSNHLWRAERQGGYQPTALCGPPQPPRGGTAVVDSPTNKGVH